MIDVNEKKLIGQHIALVPLQSGHREPLRVLAADERIWQYTPASGAGNGFDRWFDKALDARSHGEQLPLAVISRESETIVGSTRLYEINLDHKRLAIGYTWYTPNVWGTVINPEAKYLLLKFVFEEWQINRVAFYIDARHVHSCAAVKKLGAKEEGILRQHMVLESGVIRDTVVYSIIQPDWPEIKSMLEKRIAMY